MSTWKPDEYTVNEINDMITKGSLTVPQYQRGQVWNKTKKKKLIDSIKMGFPFGSILLYKKTDSEYHLIDGLQRCSTLYDYSSKPAKFFDKVKDIPETIVSQIYGEIKINGNQEAIKAKIRDIIASWIVSNYASLPDIEKINALECTEVLMEQFPTIKEHRVIHNILFEMFNKYKETCRSINNTRIPAIIYSGNEENLPEVFSRINTEGTTLTKYQIFAATWNVDKVRITDNDLDDILKYVRKFYQEIEISGFRISQDYDNDINNREVNIYQLLFGFGKHITQLYPGLFGTKKEDAKVESVGFNLVNACLANKNSKLSDLPKIMRETFNNDELINLFLKNIIKVTNEINRLLKPYFEFKLNSRTSNTSTFHTEMQICSMIANLFMIEYCDITRHEDTVIARQIDNSSRKNRKNEIKEFKEWSFINYLDDILRQNWRGTGDKQLDEIALNKKYYSEKRTREYFDGLLSTWFSDSNDSRQEISKIANPNNEEKLLLTIIYLHSFKAVDQLDTSKYDIEHLCTKKLMREKLAKYKNKLSLPVSSFGNICLLPEWDNRTKKEKTIYQDKKYREALGDRLGIIEENYTFTNENMFKFLENDNLEADEFEMQYLKFLDKRFMIQKGIILNNLFDNKQ